jgi:hypothetical protein
MSPHHARLPADEEGREPASVDLRPALAALFALAVVIGLLTTGFGGSLGAGAINVIVRPP